MGVVFYLKDSSRYIQVCPIMEELRNNKKTTITVFRIMVITV
jgi:hypothetical protein